MSLILRVFAAILLGITLAGCATAKQKQQKAAVEQRIDKIVKLNTELAAAYLQRGQLDIAMQNISKALALAPNDPGANNVMALLQWQLKEHKEADIYFNKALKASPKDAIGRSKSSKVHNNYGAFLCEQGHVNKAVEQFRLALADPLYATPAQANVNAGLCLMKKPAPLDAEVYFRAALGLDPKLPDALYQMAKISYDTGRTYSARGFIQRYFEVGEDTPQSLLLAVKIEDALGYKDAEASYAVRLKGKFPGSSEAKRLQGLSLKRN